MEGENMTIVYCDKCKEQIKGLFNVKIISTSYSDKSGHEIAELCDKCNRELLFWIDENRYKEQYGGYETSDKFKLKLSPKA